MMTYEKSNSFRYFREMSIVWLTRNSNFPVQQILQKKLSDFVELNKFFTNDLLTVYKDLRDHLSTSEPWLFPTDDGNLYMPRKFSQNIQRLLRKAKMSEKPYHPRKMSQAQIEALLSLRFSFQRPVYQQTIACALLGLQAMRPEEVAGLRKKDIDLESLTIFLADTKSQESQFLPLHPDLVQPLSVYLSYLAPKESLFVTGTGRQWNRRDVHRAVVKVAAQCDLENINPRRLRSTVGHEMHQGGVPLNAVSLVLRHSDEATTARYYLHLREIDDARRVINQFRPVATPVE